MTPPANLPLHSTPLLANAQLHHLWSGGAAGRARRPPHLTGMAVKALDQPTGYEVQDLSAPLRSLEVTLRLPEEGGDEVEEPDPEPPRPPLVLLVALLLLLRGLSLATRPVMPVLCPKPNTANSCQLNGSRLELRHKVLHIRREGKFLVSDIDSRPLPLVPDFRPSREKER